MPQLLIRSERVVLPDGMQPATIRIANGLIAGIGSHGDTASGIPEMNVGSLVVLPGLVDTHVHINDPGRAEWEGFEHATKAAAGGGVTTLVDMPLNSIPATTSTTGLEAKRAAATGRCHVDVGFWGGLVPGNRSELAPLAAAGVLGFKCFLSPSGVAEFEHVNEQDLRDALPELSRLNLPLLAHAELPALLKDPRDSVGSEGVNPRLYSTWLASRPPESERAAIDLLIRLAKEYHLELHIVHLATPDALPDLAHARRDGVRVTVETCPHYLTFAAEEIADGDTALKCAPPIRASVCREGLWNGLVASDIDLIATDHSPAPPPLKALDTGNFLDAWGGISSLQLGLAVVWTGMRARGLSLECAARWLAKGPARLAGLDARKGAIAAGYDADLVIWDPAVSTVIDGASLYHRHPVTPYSGRRLQGRVTTTLLAGQVVYHDGECRGKPRGRLLTGRRSSRP
jgi:allantoinase